MKIEIEIPDGYEQCDGPVEGGAILWANGSIETVLSVEKEFALCASVSIGSSDYDKHIWLRPFNPVLKAVEAIEEALNSSASLIVQGKAAGAWALLSQAVTDNLPTIKEALK